MTRSVGLILNCGIPLLIIGSFGALAAQPDLRTSIPMLVAVTAIITILLAVTLYAGESGSIRWEPRSILAVAFIVRLLFLSHPPELSSDIYRYLWDGLQCLAGNNPYALAPVAVEPPTGALAQLAGQINHPHLVTIYPPSAQLLFAAGAALGGGVQGLKAMLTAIDIATCYLLIRLLINLDLPPWRAVLYAWHPLSVLEIAGSGHIDGAALFFLALALLLLISRRADHRHHGAGRGSMLPDRRLVRLPFLSGLAFACAALVKLFPLLFFPGFVRCCAKRAKTSFCLGVLIGVGCLTVPFMWDILNGIDTLGLYARYWEFSGFLFKVLLNARVPDLPARLILSSIFIIAVLLLYGYGDLMGGRIWVPWKRAAGGGCMPARGVHRDTSAIQDGEAENRMLLPVLRICYSITMAFLLLTPTLFPWYALYLVGLLPFAAGSAGLAISWSVFLSYRVFIPYTLLGQWVESGDTAAVIWLTPVSAFLLCMLAGMLKPPPIRLSLSGPRIFFVIMATFKLF